MNPLGEHERTAIREVFTDLEKNVPILLELGPEQEPVTVLAGGREIDFGDETKTLLEQLAELSDRIDLTVTETDLPGQWPKTTVAGALVYRGLPWGYELTAIVGAIVEAGRTASSLTPASLETLASLERDVALEVYVTPT